MLKKLELIDNRLNDSSCATLASAIEHGRLPALKVLELRGNPASNLSMPMEALAIHSPREPWPPRYVAYQDRTGSDALVT